MRGSGSDPTCRSLLADPAGPAASFCTGAERLADASLKHDDGQGHERVEDRPRGVPEDTRRETPLGRLRGRGMAWHSAVPEHVDEQAASQ
jgi:hypothetical protein